MSELHFFWSFLDLSDDAVYRRGNLIRIVASDIFTERVGINFAAVTLGPANNPFHRVEELIGKRDSRLHTNSITRYLTAPTRIIALAYPNDRKACNAGEHPLLGRSPGPGGQ